MISATFGTIARTLVRPAPALLAVAAILTGAGPRTAAAQPATSGEFVGRVEGADAFIAVVSDGTRVFAFVCDGTEAGYRAWAWFRGPLTGERARLTDAEGNILELDLSGGGAAGRVALAGGIEGDFTTEAARDGSGLFRAEGTIGGSSFVGGWIALNDGEVRGQVLLRPAGIMADPMQVTSGGSGGFDLAAGTANITDGTSNTIVMPRRITSEIIAILIG